MNGVINLSLLSEIAVTLLIALQLLTGTAEDPIQTNNVNIAFVPLGTPLLAGPGAIVATMVFVQRADGSLPDVVAISVGIVLIHLVMWLTLRFSGLIMRVLGENGVLLVTRIAGLSLSGRPVPTTKRNRSPACRRRGLRLHQGRVSCG